MPKHARVCYYCGACIAAQYHASRMCPTCKDKRKAYTDIARALVEFAIATNRLPNPQNLMCEQCGFWAEFYDHRDYNKPMHVEPVCRSCNALRGPAAWKESDEILTTISLKSTITPPGGASTA